MAKFEGTVADFSKFLDPYLRNTIQRGTRALRVRRKHVCQHCKSQNGHLQSAHRRGKSKAEIYRKLLRHYSRQADRYKVGDLAVFMDRLIEAHKPFEKTFLFLCKPCHDKYDRRAKAKRLALRVRPART